MTLASLNAGMMMNTDDNGPSITKPVPLPLISIVTPSFNQARFIDRTIRSVLDQGYPALEYQVMDGGSTDGTVDILRRYQDRLSWVSESDGGQSAAINAGFARTRGEVLAWPIRLKPVRRLSRGAKLRAAGIARGAFPWRQAERAAP